MPQLRFAPLLSVACVAGLAAACDSSVTDDAPPVVVATPEAIAMMIGQQTGIEAAVTGADAERLEWRALEPAVAAVEKVPFPGPGVRSSAAVVRAVAVGSTVIVVGVPGRPESVDSVRVTVGPAPCPLIAMILGPQNPTLAVGDTIRFRARPVQCSGVPRDTTVTWRSIHPTVATVDSTGLATALAPGAATIVAASRENPVLVAATTLSVR